jgi:hypothetical protein
MRQIELPAVLAIALFAMASTTNADDSSAPIAAPDLVFDETDGIVAVEAEHFYKQTLLETRAWHITSSRNVPGLKPDADPAHVAGASGGAYLEILPDTRATQGDKLIEGENFADKPGVMAVLHYRVNIKTPGRYYVWVRSFSTGSEDNGVHVGLDGHWPESGQRWQTVQKRQWAWDCKQRTADVHTGVPMQIFLDIEKAGGHEIVFSLREDGFEMDKFVLALNKEFNPEGKGPAVKVKAGQPPVAFPEVAEAAPAPKQFPAHWGEPPAIQTRDLRPLPGGYGQGSSTLAKWIQDNLDKDAAASAAALKMEAASFSLEGTGYYLDKGKWLAINPDKNKTAQAKQAFPFPSGRYDVTLEAVGEEDGQSTYTVAVNDQQIGAHECPLAPSAMEEGAVYHKTWKNQPVNSGDIIAVSSTIASADGQENSRARWARINFAPADESTKAAVAKVAALAKPAAAVASAKPLTPLAQPRQPDGSGAVVISGELRQWHKVTLTLDGPFAHEQDDEPNPFTDCAMTVTFTHESGTPKYTVPGYFAADGNAGNTSAESGTRWRAHLSPDKPGQWTYAVSFVMGKRVAVSEVKGEAVKPFDGSTGTFAITSTDKTGRDFRAKGRLHYVGKHHLQFAGTGEYFLKAGPDAPENLMAYVDFDGTRSNKRRPARDGEATPDGLKHWEPHVKDWRTGDPTWKDGKGKGLLGALNYLAAKGCNMFSFLTYNAGGDGDDVWPFSERDEKYHYDCSKLDQWGVVLDHATVRGLYLHFKLQENELDDDRRGEKGGGAPVPESLDGGKLGSERRLYCRELIARFAHNLALNWNIGEENTQSTEEVRDMVKFLHDTDPYRHHIVIHTFPPQQDKVYTPLLGDRSLLTGASLQNSWNQAHQRTLKWIRESAKAGKPWVVANDEQNPADMGVPPDPGYQGHSGEGIQGGKPYTLHDIRKLCLWGTLMAGGAGVEYYFGYKLPQNDLVCQDWRSRDKSWDYCRIALAFFRDERIPFWEMQCADELVGNPENDNSRYCFAKSGQIYLVYLPTGGSAKLDLTAASGSLTVKWFNPRTGGALQDGAIKSVSGGGTVALGTPPADASEDWLAVIRK